MWTFEPNWSHSVNGWDWPQAIKDCRKTEETVLRKEKQKKEKHNREKDIPIDI